MAEASSASGGVRLDGAIFASRLRALYDNWKSNRDSIWKNADAISVMVGKEEETTYRKSFCLQHWLFGYEFPETLLVFCQNAVVVLTSAKKVSYLDKMQKEHASPIPLKLLERAPKQEGDGANFQKIITIIKEQSFDGRVVGSLPKEQHEGDLATGWATALTDAGFTDQVDVTPGFSDVFAVKDAKEIEYMRRACEATVATLKRYLVPELETVIDKGKAVSHRSLAERTMRAIAEPQKLRLDPSVFAKEVVDACYEPIVQSGGVFDLRPSAVSDDRKLHFGVIVCSLGVSYRSYCANAARTLLIDPSPDQERALTALLAAHEAAVKAIRPGATLADVYTAAQSALPAELQPHLARTLGFATGLEFRDALMTVTAKSNVSMRPGMTFNLSVGLQDLKRADAPDVESEKYALLVSDTVLVSESKTEILTEFSRKLVYNMNEDEEDTKPAARSTAASSGAGAAAAGAAGDGSRSTRAKRAAAQDIAKNEDAAAKRREHQQELARLQLEEARKRLVESGASRPAALQPQSLEAYTSAAQMPSDARGSRVFVDDRAMALLLPIGGTPTPFHIATVKNVTLSKAEDSEYTYLRINFLPPPDGAASAYLREISFRAAEAGNLNRVHRQIKELRKRFTSTETEKREEHKVVPQERLIPSKTRRIRLPDVFIRPALGRARAGGVLEAHTNGFRFATAKGESVDVMYANIKHSFFQPADNELVVLLHFRLHTPVMIGKKSSLDVQFYMEVGEMTQSLVGPNVRGGYDDVDEEQQERERRKQLNKLFHRFVSEVEDAYPRVEFDIPYREFGFFGSPGRGRVFLQPTAHCLVHLTEAPFTVLTLSDVELVHFERVQFGLREFDMVFIFKDYARPVFHINSVPVQSKDAVQDWLDSVNLKYYEGPQNLNWKSIMKTILDDPEGFFDEGGWDFLDMEKSDNEGGEGGGGSDDESEDEGEFAPSGEESASDEDSDEYESGSASEEVSDEDEDASGSGSGDESGMDWSDLEEEAKRDDAKRSWEDDEEDNKSRKRVHK